MSEIKTGLVTSVVVCLLLICFSACNVLENIPGNVAGQIMNQAGQGFGLVSVQLVNVETGGVAQQQTANDMGNFLFKEVDYGTYIIKIVAVGGGEVPSDSTEFTLNPGRTVNRNIIVYPGGKPDEDG